MIDCVPALALFRVCLRLCVQFYFNHIFQSWELLLVLRKCIKITVQQQRNSQLLRWLFSGYWCHLKRSRWLFSVREAAKQRNTLSSVHRAECGHSTDWCRQNARPEVTAALQLSDWRWQRGGGCEMHSVWKIYALWLVSSNDISG